MKLIINTRTEINEAENGQAIGKTSKIKLAL
jgi:hypothetical protein